MTDKNMTDTELDRLLAHAAQPKLPDGFAARLQAKLEVPPVSNVIAFPQRKVAARAPKRLWLSAIPLAASLLLGIYIGAGGSLADSVSGIGSTFMADTDTAFSIGIEDTESFINGDLS